MNDQSNEPDELQRTDENAQVEISPPPRNQVARPQLTAGAQIAAIIPRSFEDVQRIANMAVKSGLAARDINSIERCSYVIMFGLEIGMKPLASLQRIAIIGGRPCVWGEAVPAIAIDTGELVEFKEWDEGTGDDLTYHCKVVRKLRNGSVIEKTSRFSVAQAKKANLWDTRDKITRRNRNTGENFTIDNDSPWYRFPERMLQMRARVAFRDLFADAMCGLYIAEELVGRDSDAQMRDVTPQYERIANPLGGDDHETTNVAPKSVVAQDAPGKPVDASVDESSGRQPADAKSHQEPSAEAGGAKQRASRKRTRPDGGTVGEGDRGSTTSATASSGTPSPPRSDDPSTVTFPPPWNRKSSSDYAAYARTWIGMMTDKADARARWDSERSIRNNLANILDREQQNELQGMLGKVGQ